MKHVIEIERQNGIELTPDTTRFKSPLPRTEDYQRPRDDYNKSKSTVSYLENHNLKDFLNYLAKIYKIDWVQSKAVR